jgi:hypothetical protein
MNLNPFNSVDPGGLGNFKQFEMFWKGVAHVGATVAN